ncbi:MAG: glycoside hydrolase family protein [Burkholderiales bacterium]|nr:glycoside hydrolase family protein [Burkholderiales bacterium]
MIATHVSASTLNAMQAELASVIQGASAKPSFLSSLARRIGEVIAAVALGLARPAASRSMRRIRGEVQTRVAVLLMVLSAAGLVTIANREGFRATPYKDGAGVLTDGYGNTNNVDPKGRKTPERALVELLRNTNTATAGVKRCVKVELWQYELDVYVGLAMNIGVDAFCRSSPNPIKNPYLIDLINARRYAEACDRLLAFNKIRNPKTGQLEVSDGLTKAKQRERRQCLGEEII